MTAKNKIERAARIESLMSLMCGGSIEKGLLIKALCYNSMATFENDLAYIRKQYGAKISYDKAAKSYQLLEKGSYKTQKSSKM